MTSFVQQVLEPASQSSITNKQDTEETLIIQDASKRVVLSTPPCKSSTRASILKTPMKRKIEEGDELAQKRANLTIEDDMVDLIPQSWRPFLEYSRIMSSQRIFRGLYISKQVRRKLEF